MYSLSISKNIKDLIWLLYYIISGILTYVVFKTNILLIILFVIVFELFYFLLNRRFYDFVRRYFLNIVYLSSYIITGIIYNS